MTEQEIFTVFINIIGSSMLTGLFVGFGKGIVKRFNP